MKKYVLIAFIGLSAMACKVNAEGYKVTGEIIGAGDGTAILTLPKGFMEDVSGDTVQMKAGKFTFTGKLDGPAFMSIQVCPGNEKAASFGFIAENKPIRVNGNWADVLEQYGYRGIQNVKVQGSLNNDVSEKLGSVGEELLKTPDFKEYAEVRKKLDELRNSDADAYYKLQSETEGLSGQFSTAVRQKQLELIRQNNGVEAVAQYLKYLSDDIPLKELEETFSYLAPNVQNSPFADDVKEEIAIRRLVQPGQPAPDFNLETPDGSRMSLSDLKGKYVILDFWASWCRPCRASFPEMKNIYAKYKDQGLEILGITNDSKKENWLKALEEDQLPWKQVIDEFPIRNKPAKVATLYAIPYLPTLILVDPQGVIVGQAKDKHQLVEWLDERLGKK